MRYDHYPNDVCSDAGYGRELCIHVGKKYRRMHQAQLLPQGAETGDEERQFPHQEPVQQSG